MCTTCGCGLGDHQVAARPVGTGSAVAPVPRNGSTWSSGSAVIAHLPPCGRPGAGGRDATTRLCRGRFARVTDVEVPRVGFEPTLDRV